MTIKGIIVFGPQPTGQAKKSPVICRAFPSAFTPPQLLPSLLPLRYSGIMSVRRLSIFRQLFPPEPSWSVDSVPDQTGKVVPITGGNRGVGKETARVTFPFFRYILTFTDCGRS